MNEVIAQFHWLRPWWLLGVLPIVVMCILLWRQKRRDTQWQTIIAPQLLHYLLEGQVSRSFRWQLSALITGWIIACIALAGPTWQQIPQPIHKNESAVVLLWDLSPSMLAEDIVPSRLVRARHKITDFLNARTEGLTALVAYAGEAHVVAPLTDDTDTIINLLPALYPGMMPLPGSNVEMAVEKAFQLFADSGISSGEILVVTDGITPPAQETLINMFKNHNVRLSIFGIGTDDGAPIPTGSGGFVKEQGGDIVIAKLNSAELQDLAHQLNGAYITIRPDNQDIDYLMASSAAADPLDDQVHMIDRSFDTWRDNGQYLVLLLLPIIALAFRRGWVLPAVFAALLLPQRSLAFEWQDLWQRPDQQGQESFLNGDNETAAKQFANPQWKGAAQYRNNDFDAAAKSFAQPHNGETLDANGQYNRGNALAKAGKLQDALDAYQQALDLNPDMDDAQFNADLIKKLLEQQQQGNSQGQNNPNNNQQKSNQQQKDSDGQQGQNQNQQAQQNQQQSAQQDSQQNASQQNDTQQVGIDEQAAADLADREQQPQNQQQQGEQGQQQQKQQQQLTQSKQPQEQQQGEAGAQQALAEQNNDDSEQQQALEQWLRQIPDDPSGLLRRKFEYQHRQLRRQYQSGEWSLPENRAYERW